MIGRLGTFAKQAQTGGILKPYPSQKSRMAAAFTLVEMMVATVILVIIVGILFSITQTTSNVWKNTTGKVEVFRGARSAFETITRTISQATLNTYYDYVDSSGNFRGSGMTVSGTSSFLNTTFVPNSYARQSDLHFICGQGATLLATTFSAGGATYTPVTQSIFFQAPLGQTLNSSYTSLDRLLNACGFYVTYGPDNTAPSFVPTTPRYRYRLMQFTQAADANMVYTTAAGATNQNSWFTTPIAITYDATSNFVLADNIIALVVWPKLSAGDQTASNALTTDYTYDSRKAGFVSGTGFLQTFNQLPPVVQVTMVAIDEASAAKLGNSSTPPNAKVGLTSTIFTSATYPTIAGQQNQLQADLATMQTTLAANHINYRVFQTDVAIRGAKWTTN